MARPPIPALSSTREFDKAGPRFDDLAMQRKVQVNEGYEGHPNWVGNSKEKSETEKDEGDAAEQIENAIIPVGSEQKVFQSCLCVWHRSSSHRQGACL
jgi:hypothetical protein